MFLDESEDHTYIYDDNAKTDDISYKIDYSANEKRDAEIRWKYLNYNPFGRLAR